MVPEAYKGREQTYVKHTLLRKYLDRFGYKIGSAWDTINYVDCFAGPWQSTDPDCGDTSFGLAINALTTAQRNLAESIGRKLRLRFCLIESDLKSFHQLEAFAERNRRLGREIVTLQGEFEDHLQEVRCFVNEGTPKAFRFLLLDPKGWTGFALRKVAPLVDARSAEILVNVMTYHIRRFVKLVRQKEHARNFAELFGEEHVAEEAAALSGKERERFLIQKYADNLKRLAGFRFTSTAAVFRPAEDTVHYYLVFGTNSPHGIQVFKEAERIAFETGESVRDEAKTRKRVARTQQSEMDIFGEGLRPPSEFALRLRETYRKRAHENLNSILHPGASVSYDDLVGTVLQTPLVWETDLLAWIAEMVAEGSVIVTPPLGRKKLRLEGNFVLKRK